MTKAAKTVARVLVTWFASVILAAIVLPGDYGAIARLLLVVSMLAFFIWFMWEMIREAS